MQPPLAMLDSHLPVRRAGSHLHPALAIAVAFLVLHAFLAVAVDARNPDVFLRADRALERMETIQSLLEVRSSGEFVEFLSTHGIVGDYAVHALLYLIGSQIAVVSAQIALTVLSGIAVYGLGGLLGLSSRWCAVAMTVYLLLPHNLVFPHQLATEALHVPLLVLSSWLLADGVRRDRPRRLIASALCLGFATLIRPITLLWPIVAGATVATTRRPADGALHGALALMPVLVWMTFMATQTGTFGLGRSGHSMEANLYMRVMRITATLPPAQRDAARAIHLDPQSRMLGPIGYLRFAIDHPVATFRHTARDAGAFFVKSGIERITLDYAGRPNAAVVQSHRSGWRQQLELHGPIHTALFLWRNLGFVLIFSILGAAAMLGLVTFALMGAGHYVRRWRNIRQPEIAIGLMLTALVGYIFLFSQVLNAMQSRTRAPAEFALVLLAVVGWKAVMRRRDHHACAATGMRASVARRSR